MSASLARIKAYPQAQLTGVTSRYTIDGVIKSFAHKGLKDFFDTGKKSGIQPHHAAKLGRQLARLDNAKNAADMNVPGWGLHPLTGNLAGHHSITVNGNWRMTFKFEGEDAVLVDYQDYH